MATTWTPEQVLLAISGVESGGNYKARSKSSSASGKYQWIRSTWNNYGGFAEAWQAPPEVQERRAREDIAGKLHAYGGDVRKAIMSWFLPAAVTNPKLAGTVPKGNKLTPNQYADMVMARLGVKVKTATNAPSLYSSEIDTPAAPVGRDEDGTLAGQLANFMVGMSQGRNIQTGEF